MSGEMLNHVKQHIEDLQQLKSIHVWMDCGPHFRCYEHLGYWQAQWFAIFLCDIFLIFFVERHGKGLVDGLFALVRTWIKEYMLSTSARIVEVDDLLSVLVEGAARSERRDEGGPRYVVEKVEPSKPLTSQRVEHVRFQVQKTYCLSIRARGSGQRDPPHWRNHVFSDLVSAPAEGHIVKLDTMPEDGGDWRRGYYGQQRWLATKPKKGTRSTMMLRFDVQHDHDIEDAEHMTVWERTTLAMVRRQALRRARQQRLSGAMRKRIDEVLQFQGDAEASEASGGSD